MLTQKTFLFTGTALGSSCRVRKGHTHSHSHTWELPSAGLFATGQLHWSGQSALLKGTWINLKEFSGHAEILSIFCSSLPPLPPMSLPQTALFLFPPSLLPLHLFLPPLFPSVPCWHTPDVWQRGFRICQYTVWSLWGFSFEPSFMCEGFSPVSFLLFRPPLPL